MGGTTFLKNGSSYRGNIISTQWKKFHETGLLHEIDPQKATVEHESCKVNLREVKRNGNSLGFYLPFRLMPDLVFYLLEK